MKYLPILAAAILYVFAVIFSAHATGFSYAPQWATTAIAQAGTDTTHEMNAARVKDAISNIVQSAPVGILVGRAYTTEATNLQLTTSLPIDDTIPQITEGTAVTSIAYSAKKASDRIRITFSGYITGPQNPGACALFIDAGSNAVDATSATPAASGSTAPLYLSYETLPADTASHTYAIRCGVAAGSTSIRMNGLAAARLFGGVSTSSEQIDEFTE